MTDGAIPYDYDFIVVGSGFGGSVSALRLVEKGYRVAVLEMGRRWGPETLPKSNWAIARWIWWPALGLRGFFSMRLFRHLRREQYRPVLMSPCGDFCPVRRFTPHVRSTPSCGLFGADVRL